LVYTISFNFHKTIVRLLQLQSCVLLKHYVTH